VFVVLLPYVPISRSFLGRILQGQVLGSSIFLLPNFSSPLALFFGFFCSFFGRAPLSLFCPVHWCFFFVAYSLSLGSIFLFFSWCFPPPCIFVCALVSSSPFIYSVPFCQFSFGSGGIQPFPSPFFFVDFFLMLFSPPHTDRVSTKVKFLRLGPPCKS